MGFIVKQKIETFNGDILDEFYVRIENYQLDKLRGVIGVSIAHYETSDAANANFPKYSTETLTDKIFLADNDYGNVLTQKYGLSEQWYYPMSCDRTKSNLKWEHVWLAKIVYGMDEELLKKDTQRFFDEIWELGGEKFLQHFRFTKYWDKSKHG